jgi:WD40 repeat protein
MDERLPMPGPSHTADQSIDMIHDGLETVLQQMSRLKEENESLVRAKALFTVHIQQYETDIADLRSVYKTMKARFAFVPRLPASLPFPESIQSDLKSLAHAEIPWRVISTDSFYDRSRVRLRYALRMDAILCTVHFNADGSLFSFTNGSTVFLILTADGSLIGTCDLPEPRIPTDGHARAICFSPDSRYLVVSGPGNSVIIIDVESRRIVKTLDAHTSHVSTVTFFNKSQQLITGGFDRKLCVWSTNDFKMVKSIQHGGDGIASGKDEDIVAVAIAGDDEYVCVGFMNGIVGIYEPTFQQPMTSFAAHQEYLLNLAISPNKLIATASHDKTAKLWMIRGTAKYHQTLTGHADYVLGVVFSPKDLVVFTGSKDETIKCWSVKTGQELFTLTGHRNTLFQIDHHPTKRTIVSCSGDGLVCLWDYDLPEGKRKRAKSCSV